MRLTKRFMDWYQGNNDKEKETPAGGIKRVGYVLCCFFYAVFL